MSAVLIIACSSACLVMLGMLVIASGRARDGYEDELGFHHGAEPKQRTE